jgi:hypothetical protein
MNTANNSKKTKAQRPAWKLRLGVLNIACWKARLEGATPDREFFTFSVQRSFRNKQGEWQNTQSIRKQDLLPMARLLERAFDEASEKPEE